MRKPAEEAIAQLNLAMQELYSWCLTNKLTPHPGKSETMLISRKSHTEPIAPILIGGYSIKWVNKTRLLGMTADHKLTWVPHTLDLKKSFANKLCLLKKMRFLPRNVLQDFSDLRVILSSVNYGLISWGACCNSDIINSLEKLNCIERLELFLMYSEIWYFMMFWIVQSGSLFVFTIN